MRVALENGQAVERRAAIVSSAARSTSQVWPGRLLPILVVRTSAPIAADRLMVLVRRDLAGVIGFAALSLPVASDRDVFRVAAILLAGLFRLLGRLRLLDRGGLRLCRAFTECERQYDRGQQGCRC
ncbi:hypothetical protein XI06_30100 [Bradyrhizobium sp. CCBAU 11434]|nr:hypothetical protein [Bradyrhizobium sp. CCBAU 11434]